MKYVDERWGVNYTKSDAFKNLRVFRINSEYEIAEGIQYSLFLDSYADAKDTLQYNTHSAYRYDITYSPEVCNLDGDDIEYTITTNDGLIVVGNAERLRIYDIFASTSDSYIAPAPSSELSSLSTVYSMSDSTSPLDEQMYYLNADGKYELLIVKHENDNLSENASTQLIAYTTIIMPGPIDALPNNNAYIFYNDVGQISFEDITYIGGNYAILKKTSASTVDWDYPSHLYANQIVVPNKPFYRIRMLGDGEIKKVTFTGTNNTADIETPALFADIKSYVTFNPIFATCTDQFITLKLTLNQKSLVGVL